MDDATTLVAGSSGPTTVTDAPWHAVLPATTGTVSTDERVVVLDAGRDVTFGRAATTRLRIGHAPVDDDVVPAVAGKVFVRDDRVVVANLHDVLAFDIRVEGRPLISVAPGDWHSPRERNYGVLVTGTYTYELAVTIDTSSEQTHAVGTEVLDHPGPPSGARPRLTERQRRILDAYVAPLADGAPAASHQQVAEAVGISRSLVRLECHKILNELLAAGVPMRPLGDARDEVADAWARHRF